MVFWLGSLILLCQAAAYSAIPYLNTHARAVNEYFGHHTLAFMAAPVIILCMILYFHFSRTRLTWAGGVRIDGKPIEVVHYQFKRLINNVPVIYLQTPKHLYIFYPVTSQDGRKMPNVKIMKREAAENEVQVEKLKAELEASAATLKKFWFFTKEVPISFLVLVVIVAIIILAQW
ncbi:hypothetical protein LJ707_18815 [Mucilaginibacter sp. UR6-1]|uniref:hypothetical protein n=1 Tax=Mucilaginibacter sp. UR6-1 TaxID=1435643 RepID=UPI001E305235|nr:hypothetical protein [Mucilaginibacter sp. UR6-1]MCC8410999.1 hypothetical protein [Mucilaginibacter sp. UR6-1]